MTKNKKIWFISAASYEDALNIVKEKNFKPRTWKYIPHDKKLRFMAIAGFHSVLKENLIGTFSDEEILYLTIESPSKDEIHESPEIEEHRANTVICQTSDKGLYLEKKDEKIQEKNRDKL